MENTDSIHDKRGINKISLENYVLDKRNLIDHQVDKIIYDQMKENKRRNQEYESILELEKNDPERFKELEEEANLTGHSLRISAYILMEDILFTEDEITALYEMKIIYAFKHLEINIKKLLRATYADNNIVKQSKWEMIISFLNSKGIKIKEVDGFKNVDELRIVNNSLKHADRNLDQSLNSIPEFKNKDNFSYRELDEFYERVKSAPIKFLESLAKLIYNDLYVFQDSRIEKIAMNLALRMEKSDALKFIKALNENYK